MWILRWLVFLSVENNRNHAEHLFANQNIAESCTTTNHRTTHSVLVAPCGCTTVQVRSDYNCGRRIVYWNESQNATIDSPEVRTFLPDVLEHSLTGGEFTTLEIAAQWSAEFNRRITAYDRGETDAVDSRAALERIRTRLVEHRSRTVSP